VMGRVVRTLLRNRSVSGSCVVDWDGRNDRGAEVAAGIYIVRLDNGKQAVARKLVLTR